MSIMPLCSLVFSKDWKKLVVVDTHANGFVVMTQFWFILIGNLSTFFGCTIPTILCCRFIMTSTKMPMTYRSNTLFTELQSRKPALQRSSLIIYKCLDVLRFWTILCLPSRTVASLFRAREKKMRECRWTLG